MYKDFIKKCNKWDDLAEKAYKLQELAKHYSKLASEHKKKLVHVSGEQSSVGFSYALKKEGRLGSVEYCKIPELQFVDLDRYRKSPVIVWRLEVAKNDIQELINISL